MKTTDAPSAPKSKLLLWALGIVVVLSLGAAVGLHWRRSSVESKEANRRATTVNAGPRVFVAEVKTAGVERNVTLPGDARAFNQATLYAKVSGYLKEMRVDKGDLVKKDQIIGILESPDADQQVVAAQADLIEKRRQADRAHSLAPQGVMSKQELETAEANLEVSKANLARAQALKDYERVRAPFDGVVTGRYVDVGALLPAATGSTSSALPLIDLAEIDRLRITVYVGQETAPFIREGDPATVTLDERPDLKIEAKVSRLATAIDPRSRAMLTEVWIDNREYKLYPGSFVHVSLHVRVPPMPVVPSEALVMRGDGMFAAVLRGDQIFFVPVRPGLDDGKQLQVRNGLQSGEWVALNLPAQLEDGARIQPVRRDSTQATAAPAQPSNRVTP